MILQIFANYPPRKRLGLLAILLGFISIFAGSPFDKVETKINAKEMSMISAKDITNVKVEQLADDIIKEKYDYRLIDLRKSEEFAKYNIPSSENIQVDQLLKSDLARNTNILLYSDNDFETAQAWFLLKSNNFKGVSVLNGGLKSWQENILFPTCGCDAIPTIEQQHKHSKLAEISKHFGGSMQSGSVADSKVKMTMPELEASAGITLKKTKGKKKREGC